MNTVWIGDAESGKTSLLTSYTQDIFPQEYVPTVFENYTAKVPALDGTERMINLNMRATAGEDEFDHQTLSKIEQPMALRPAVVATHQRAPKVNFLEKSTTLPSPVPPGFCYVILLYAAGAMKIFTM